MNVRHSRHTNYLELKEILQAQKLPLIENKRLSKELFTSLLPLFMQEALDEFCNFQIAYDDKNIEDAKLILHKLSGVSKSYGALPLVDRAQKIEQNISEGIFLEKDLRDLQNELECIFRFIKDEYQVILS